MRFCDIPNLIILVSVDTAWGLEYKIGLTKPKWLQKLFNFTNLIDIHYSAKFCYQKENVESNIIPFSFGNECRVHSTHPSPSSE